MSSHPALLPERHPESDFFITDIFDAIPLKDDLHTMEHPFFSVDPKPKMEVLRYHRNGVDIKISPHYSLGLPTMSDKDILLYCGSLVMAQLNKGNTPPRTLRFSAHDLMITTNRDTSGKGYEMLKNAFERLAGCLIVTNIKADRGNYTSGFHLLESYQVIKKNRDGSRMVEVEVRLSDWFYKALVGREVLTINRNYFRLRKPIERRLYELARKHCGRQDSWEINLDTLQKKVGSSSELKKFRLQLRNIIQTDTEENHFPDYRIELVGQDTVIFSHKPNSSVLDPEQRKEVFVPPALNLEDLFQEISDSAQKNVIRMCYRNRYDFIHLAEEFAVVVQKKGMPKNLSGAFVNFAKKKFEP